MNEKKEDVKIKIVKNILAVIVFLITISYLNIVIVIAVQPYGANYTHINTMTAPADLPQSIPAQAGNVTELNIFGYSTTQSWQGYFGNITGTIQLADANDKVMYNWSLASPEGEVYASTNGSGIQWTSVQCFNFTATGSYDGDTAGGGTSLNGTNLSQLEFMFNIASDDADGVNETFIAANHSLFYTSNLEFDYGECKSTNIFSDAGKGELWKFEEVLLYEPVSSSIIFTSVLEQDLLGFDNRNHDFEMMVLEDGHGTDTQVTTYYFYVELQ